MKKVSYSFSFVDSPVMASRSGKQSKFGQLLEAAKSGNLRQIKKLGKELDNGKGIREAIASVRDSEGHSVLHAAASKGRTNVFKYFIDELKLNVNEKDNNDCTPLLHATLEGHFSTVEYLIDNGADPAALNKHDITALHFATTEGHIEMMRLLLSKGVDVNAPSDIGTPLQLAAEFCKQDIFKVLLDHGASPNPVDSVSPTALDLCISQRSLECAKLLLQAGADPNAVSCGATPLASAAREGEIEFVKCLLKAGADPNIENDVGMKPIEIAAKNGNRREVGHLFPLTSPIPSCSDWSIGGIMKYVQSDEANEQIKLRVKEKNFKAKSEGDNSLKRKDYMRALFSYTEAIAADPSDATALSSRSCCFACIGDGSNAWADAKACTRLRPDWPEAHYRAGVALGLLEKFDMAADSFLLGVKLDPKDNDLRDAFRFMMMGSVYTILLLTDHSFAATYPYSSLYILSREAHQPLMPPRSGKKSIIDQIIDAAFVGNIRRIKKLAREMDEGKGMSETMGSIKDSAGRTVLHTAAMMGKINVCKYWLEELKLPVDERDDEEVTPLFHAILQGHPSTVAYLIENGADPAALTRHNVNALHVALMKGSGNVELFSFLLSKGLDVNASSDMGTPLQWAAQQCRHDLLKVLLDHGANPNISINLLPSPLMWTLLKKSLPCTKLLIQAGADPNGVSSGKTPLMCAVKTGEDKLIKCLLNAGADPNVTDDTGLKAIEIAAYDGIHRAVRILLPVTSRIPACSDWSISGIMKYVHSEEAKEQERIRERERILEEKSNGDDALKRKEYMEAMMHYTKAMALGHSDADAAAFSNRSLCMACLGYPDLALSDAEVCIKLRPDWSEGYCRAGVALYLLEKFNMAADVLLLGLKLDPQNKELKDAFRKVVEAKMNSVHI